VSDTLEKGSSTRKDHPPNTLRIVFMGTPDFALPSFHALARTEDLVGVVTQPDRPKGRKGLLTPPPLKTAAAKLDLPIFQPERLKKSPELLATFVDLNPDLIVVVAFGQILPESVLKIPKYGCINVHASLLPKYRGAGPIQWAIIQGDRETGVSTMQMDVGMDTGPVLLKRTIPIGADDTAASLSPKLAELGARLLLETMALLKVGRLVPVPQENSLATLAPLIKKEDGEIDWKCDARVIFNRWRGLFPWPGLTTFYEKERWKLCALEVGAEKGCLGKPGEILRLSDRGLEVATGDGYIIITSLQPAGKREMRLSEYVAGHRIEVGAVLSFQKRN